MFVILDAFEELLGEVSRFELALHLLDDFLGASVLLIRVFVAILCAAETVVLSILVLSRNEAFLAETLTMALKSVLRTFSPDLLQMEAII